MVDINELSPAERSDIVEELERLLSPEHVQPVQTTTVTYQQSSVSDPRSSSSFRIPKVSHPPVTSLQPIMSHQPLYS